MAEPALPAKVSAVHRALADRRIPHAYGGALALAYYAEPRATIDIDLNLFVSATEHGRVAAVLAPLGVDVQVDQDQLEREGQARVWWGRTPIDLFYAYERLHAEMAKAIRVVPFGDEKIPILAPEHLIVCKATFDRPKDWIDVEQMIALVEHLDASAIEADLVRIVGPADQRLLRFQALLGARDASPGS